MAKTLQIVYTRGRSILKSLLSSLAFPLMLWILKPRTALKCMFACQHDNKTLLWRLFVVSTVWCWRAIPRQMGRSHKDFLSTNHEKILVNKRRGVLVKIKSPLGFYKVYKSLNTFFMVENNSSKIVVDEVSDLCTASGDTRSAGPSSRRSWLTSLSGSLLLQLSSSARTCPLTVDRQRWASTQRYMKYCAWIISVVFRFSEWKCLCTVEKLKSPGTRENYIETSKFKSENRQRFFLCPLTATCYNYDCSHYSHNPLLIWK